MGREAGEFQESHLGVAFLGEITGRIWVVSWQEDVEGTGRGHMEAALWIVGGSMLTCVPRRLVIALVWTKARSPCAGPWRNVTCSRPTRLAARSWMRHARARPGSPAGRACLVSAAGWTSGAAAVWRSVRRPSSPDGRWRPRLSTSRARERSDASQAARSPRHPRPLPPSSVPHCPVPGLRARLGRRRDAITSRLRQLLPRAPGPLCPARIRRLLPAPPRSANGASAGPALAPILSGRSAESRQAPFRACRRTTFQHRTSFCAHPSPAPTRPRSRHSSRGRAEDEKLLLLLQVHITL